MPYGVVYGLYDPRTMELRYVGQTTSSLVVRVRGHMCGANLRANRHASHWLSQLKDNGLRPLASGRNSGSLAAEFGVSKTCIGRRVRQSKNG